MYLLDTNTLIYFFKGEGNVARNLLNRSPRDIAIPSIAFFELEVGIAKSKSSRKRRSQLEQFVSVVSIVPFSLKEARAAASIRAQLDRKGTPIGPLDTLIAGTALAHRAVLVTHNTREFARVPRLKVEDWF